MQLLRGLLLLTSAGVATASRASRTGGGLSPVTRVVNLLKGLGEKCEKELKEEQSLFIKYQCWAKTVVSEKTKSNEAAKTRKDSLETYVSDLDAGRIEMTTERADLEKELEGILADIQSADEIREKEHEDYEAAKTELKAALDAMDAAIEVLEEASGDKPSLLLLSSKGQQSMEARAAQGESLNRAIEVGHRVLSKGDAEFLDHLLSGDVPNPDWKKLNKDADFKKKYKARSKEIIKLLETLRFQMSAGLDEAEAKEKKAVEVYDKLMKAKKEQRDTCQDNLVKLTGEKGARGLSKQEAEDEIEALGKQIEDDKKFIEDTDKSLEDKAKEWDDRKQVRADEQAAIAKAIAILYSDDARDLFKRSLTSQGYLLLQASAQKREASRAVDVQRRKATQALAQAARRSGDKRLAALAKLATQGAPAHFAEVITAIDDMVTQLEDEEKEDLKTKEDCEKTRSEDTRTAITGSREIDELSDKVTRLEEEIDEIKTEIEQKNEEIAETEKALADAEEVRAEEKATWEKTDADDADAIDLIGKAKTVLEDFYSSAGGALVQKGKKKDDPIEVTAGEAPPPPPSTWKKAYTGKQEESTGIVSMLDLIKKDITADKEKADAAEKKAQKEFDDMKTESEDSVKTLEKDITDLETTMTGKETKKGEAEEERETKKGDLETILKKIKEEAPGCDFFTINFETRAKNRGIEIDGLKQAKAILSGAEASLVEIKGH